MHFYRFYGKNLQLSLLSSPLDLHEQNGPLRETLATDISLAFARASTPCLIYQYQQAKATSHPLHQEISGSGRQTIPPNRAAWLQGPFARSTDEMHLTNRGEEETEPRFVQIHCCGLCVSVYFAGSDH